MREKFHSVCTPYLSVFSPNAGKYRPEKTPYLDTFHAVLVLSDHEASSMFRLTHFQPMVHLWRNYVIGFYQQMCEKHKWKSDILSKDAGR